MFKPFATAAFAAACAVMPMSASAHFVLAYTPDTLIESPGDVAMKLIFWHPFENGHVMEMEAPQAVYAVHRGEKIDLSGSLEKMTFSGVDNAATGYDIALPVKRSGDYVVVVEPAPYLEKSEDLYIQQFTKVFVNRNGMPTDWDSELGLAAEILPMVKPYNVIAGSSFTGRVMAAGKPVAGAEIEVEYMAAEPDMDTNAPKPATVSAMPGGAVVIKSDEDGYFTFAIPRAGHWGFAALGVGPVTEHEGKELSQDAVIWVRAFEME